MLRRRMGAIRLASSTTTGPSPQTGGRDDHGPVVEEIGGLIRLYKDGHVERPPDMPEAPCTWSPEPGVRSGDVAIDRSAGTWARFYVPRCRRQQGEHLPLLVYFHGGGFCVGSAAWSCYHEFLARLASRAGCVVMSVNYRLAPEHRLPACYKDGLAAVKWARAPPSSSEPGWWRARCDPSRVYLGGDSAGGAIAYNVAAQLCSPAGPPAHLRGLVLIQPFFGGETRTGSERSAAQPPKSALTLAAADCYWRMALPPGADRDHPWCNPMGKGPASTTTTLERLRLPPVLVCISEADILKDRNMEFCRAVRKAGKTTVEHAVYAGVGHAFQVLHNYHMSQARTQEMLTHINGFLSNYR